MNSTVIGIFDRDTNVDNALKRLDDNGFDTGDFEVIDRMKHEGTSTDAAGPAILPGMAPGGAGGGVSASPAQGVPGPSRVNEIEQALSHVGLTAEEMEFYFHGISDDSRLLVGPVPPQRAAEAAELLRDSHAERVSLHSSR